MSLKIGTLSALATLVLASPLAHAVEALEGPIEITPPAEDSYVKEEADNTVIRTGLNECLRLGGWSEDDRVDACEGIEPVAEVVAPEPAPEPAPVPAEPIITTATLGAEALFDFDSDTLSDASEAALGDLLAQLEKFQEISDIQVVGHTDSTGPETYNQGLSERRAKSVSDFIAAAYPDVNISSEGMGETAPVASNSTSEGRQLNRRVEVQVTAKSVTDA